MEELVEVFGAGERVVVEVGTESHHDGPDILDLWLLRFGSDGDRRHQDHERERIDLTARGV